MHPYWFLPGVSPTDFYAECPPPPGSRSYGMGPLTINKMALPSMYRQRWRHIHAFIGRNTIALRVQRFPAGASVTCLTNATDWLAVIGPVIHGESKSQVTRSSLDHVGTYFVNNRHSSQNSGCILYWRFWPNWWSEKIWVGIPQNRGAPYIRGASYIRDKKVIFFSILESL